MKKVRVKLILQPVTKADILSKFSSSILMRTSGPVRILRAAPACITYRFVDSQLDHQSYNADGFYRIVGRIITKYWDQDDLWYPVRPSFTESLLRFLPYKDAFIVGTPTIEHLRAGLIHRTILMELDREESMLFVPNYLIRTNHELLM